MIDATRPGAVFHKFVFNFHPVKEDTRKDLNLWEVTKKTLEHIKTQFGDSVPFVATISRRPHLASACSRIFHCRRETQQRGILENKGLMEDRLSRSMAPAPAP